MFVRWQRRARGRNYWGEFHPSDSGDAYVAMLVESVRIEGKPRQKTVAYLGTVRSEADSINSWQTVLKRLDQSGLSPDMRRQAVEGIAKRIGWLTRDQVQAHINFLIGLWGARAAEYVKPAEFECLGEVVR